MVQGKNEKRFALIASLLMGVIKALPIAPITLHADCLMHERLLYPFFHVTWLHLIVNLWCFLSLVFIYGVRWRHLALAYIIAVTFPTALCPLPTMGLSGVCFALMGLWACKVERKGYYQTYIWSFIGLSGIFGGVNMTLHAECFLVGSVMSYICWRYQKWRKR